jgi:hypothetical protein
MSWGHSGLCEKDCTCDVARMFSSPKKERVYKCWCGKYQGTKHGLLTHQIMTKHLTPTSEGKIKLPKSEFTPMMENGND